MSPGKSIKKGKQCRVLNLLSVIAVPIYKKAETAVFLAHVYEQS